MLQPIIISTFLFLGMSCQTQTEKGNKTEINNQMTEVINETKLDSTILGAGCFWCVEAVFQRVPGVKKIISGYSGGQVKDPSYKEVCEGTTGHAEVIKLVYNPEEVSFETLLSVFWQTHDPTTLNRQGNDVGTQYRSAIFYLNENQKNIAEKIKKDLDSSGAFRAPIVTEISAYSNFYEAEDYHQNYYNQNSSQGYCQYVIAPKLEKFEKVFGDQFRKK
jgi:peptide-methionine (S)-S-oxide reductase